MRQALFAAFVMLVPTWAIAQQVSVRSGEHGDFTRLVFDIPSGLDWAVTPTDQGHVRLQLDKAGLTYDTAATFDRINRARVADLRPVSGTSHLDIVLACRCRADTFLLRDRMLVVDIKPDESAPEPVEVATPSAPPPDAPLVAALTTVRVGDRPGIGPARTPDPLLPNLPVSDRIERQQQTPDIQPSAIGAQIAQDLAWAATTGLLEPVIVQESVDLVASPPPNSKDPAANAQAPSPDLVTSLANGLSDLSHDTGAGRVVIGGSFCAPDSALGFSDWVPSNLDLNAAMAIARGDLFGEFDRIDPDALKVHVRTLLHFGFGLEAREALKLDPNGSEPMLQALSFLVDGEPDPMRWFSGQGECDTAAAFWAVLDLAEEDAPPTIETDAVLRAFEALPRHLSEHLGPVLAENLTFTGQTDTARDVLRRLKRMKGGTTNEIALKIAELDILDGNPEAAKDTLQVLARTPGPEAIDAVAAAVDVADATDAPVSDHVLELSGALAKELRDSEDGPTLWRAHVRSLVVNNLFDQAFIVLKDDEGIPTDIRADAREHALYALVENADDVTFLKVAFRPEILKETQEDPILTIAFADRLLALGMPEPALERLERVPDAESNREARKSRARALLAMSRPEEAEILLIGLQGDDVALLRAEARARMGDHDYAKSVFARIGEQAEATDSAWLSGDWDGVVDGGDETFTPVAELIRTDQPVVAEGDPKLSEAADLTDASAQSRETLRALLEATRIEPVPAE